MYSRIQHGLEKILAEKSSPNPNQTIIDNEKRNILRLLELIPIDELCSYKNTLGQNIAFGFAGIDFIEGIQYIAEQNQEKLNEILFEKDLKGKTAWVFAIVNNATAIMNYYLTHYSDRKAELFANDLQEAVINNDINKAKEILETLEIIPTDAHGSDPLEDAVLLNRVEIALSLLENDKLNDQLKIPLAMDAAIISRNTTIITHFINCLLEDKRIEDLANYLYRVFKTNLLRKWFITFFINNLAQHTEFSRNEIIQLITVPLQFTLENAVFYNKTEFFDTFNQIKSLLPDDKQSNALIKKIVTEVIETHQKDEHYLQWELFKPGENRINLIEHTPRVIKDQLKLNLFEKLNSHPFLCSSNIFDQDERNLLLVKSMLNKQPTAFFYYLDKDHLTYHDTLKNNFLHIAVKAKFDVAVYAFYKLKPELFTEKNADNKLPIDIMPDFSLLKTLTDPDWQIYHKIKENFVIQDCFVNTLVNDPKWGTLPQRFANCLSRIEEAITIVNSNKLPPQQRQACYLEISEYLFTTLSSIWSCHTCNEITINDLLIKFYDMTKSNLLILPTKMYAMLSLFSRYGNHDKALEVNKELLQIEMNVAHGMLSRVKISYLRLTMLGLYASKLINGISTAAYYSKEDLNLIGDQTILRTILFKFVASQDSVATVLENDLEQFAGLIKNMDVNSIKVNKHKYELYTYVHLSDYIEACGVMINWANLFFNLSNENMANHKHVIFANEVKILFLEKLKVLMTTISNVLEASLPNFFSINNKITMYTEQLDKGLILARESITQSKKEMKLAAQKIKPKKVLPVKKIHKKNKRKVKKLTSSTILSDTNQPMTAMPEATSLAALPELIPQEEAQVAVTPLQIMPAPATLPFPAVPKKIDYSIYKPVKSFFDEMRVDLIPHTSTKFSKSTCLPHRFFEQKDKNYLRNMEALDLSPKSERIYFFLKQYCKLIAELADSVGQYLLSKPIPDERTQQFFEIAKLLTSCDPTSFPLQQYKNVLSDLIDWIACELDVLQGQESLMLQEKQELIQSQDFYSYEQLELENAKPYLHTFNLGSICYILNLDAMQYINQLSQAEVQQRLSEVGIELIEIKTKIDMFTAIAPKLKQAKDLLNKELCHIDKEEIIPVNRISIC